MRRNFEELRKFLRSHYPALAAGDSIKGELYPVPPMAEAIANAGSLLQVGGVAVAFGGSAIFNALGVPEPAFVSTLYNHKVATLGVLMVVNSICGSFRTTGAFEVSIDGDVVFSRLEEKIFPTGARLLEEFDAKGIERNPSSYL